MRTTTVLALATAAALAVAPATAAESGVRSLTPAQVEHDHHAEIQMMDEAIDRIDRMIEHTDDILDALDEMDAILDRLSPREAPPPHAPAGAQSASRPPHPDPVHGRTRGVT